MITARATLPDPAHPDDPHVIVLTVILNGDPLEEHKATTCGGHEEPRALGSRWEAIANALIASGLKFCDQMAREAWFASICQAEDPNLRFTADRARDIVSGHIGADRLREIYQTAA